MFKSVLIVCTGNICRSPTGAYLLRRSLPGIIVDSAGTGALIGEPADANAARIAAKAGLSLDGHQGRQLTKEMARQYELILVMEYHHLEQVGRIAPEARGKTMLFGHWLGARDIPDPYRKSIEAYEFVFQLLELAAERWVEKICA